MKPVVTTQSARTTVSQNIPLPGPVTRSVLAIPNHTCQSQGRSVQTGSADDGRNVVGVRSAALWTETTQMFLGWVKISRRFPSRGSYLIALLIARFVIGEPFCALSLAFHSRR